MTTSCVTHECITSHPWVSQALRINTSGTLARRVSATTVMTHSHMRRNSFTCATWLIYMCDMTHLHVRHDSFTCATWLIYKCDLTHSHTCSTSKHHHDTASRCCSFISVRICVRVMPHICMSHVAHVNLSCRTCEWVMPHMWMSYVDSMSSPCEFAQIMSRTERETFAYMSRTERKP